MFTQLRHDMITRSQRLQREVARARAEHRRIRDEYHLAKAERPRGVARLADLLARYNGVTLYPDRIERAGQEHSLAGVRASVVERSAAPGEARIVTLVISGRGWEWSVPAAALAARRAHGFAALVNSHATAVASAAAPRPVTATGQFRVLNELRGTGVLTEDEFSTAIQRLGRTA